MVKKGVNKMAKVDIISGFLGAGKTTLIKKLLNESLKDEKLVLIENEFGEIGIDGGFMRDAGITVNELSQGCICCSLAGDFETALKEVVDTYHPDRIIIEPTGVGKLSDIIAAVQKVHGADLTLDRFFTVVDAKKCKMYHKNFGEFFNNQIGAASCVILSRSQDVSEEKIAECLDIIRELNPHAPVVTTPWDQITGDMILEASNHKDALEKALIAAEKEHQESVHGHHHEHHHHHDEDDCCGHNHHEEHHHEHHHHDDDDCCGHDHHHHHPDEVFTSWGKETPKKFTEEGIRAILDTLSKEDSDEYGIILRAKGIVPDENGKWIHFDLVPGEDEVRYGSAEYTGRICVIGSKLNEDKLAELFGL